MHEDGIALSLAPNGSLRSFEVQMPAPDGVQQASGERSNPHGRLFEAAHVHMQTPDTSRIVLLVRTLLLRVII